MRRDGGRRDIDLHHHCPEHDQVAVDRADAGSTSPDRSRWPDSLAASSPGCMRPRSSVAGRGGARPGRRKPGHRSLARGRSASRSWNISKYGRAAGPSRTTSFTGASAQAAQSALNRNQSPAMANSDPEQHERPKHRPGEHAALYCRWGGRLLDSRGRTPRSSARPRHAARCTPGR